MVTHLHDLIQVVQLVTNLNDLIQVVQLVAHMYDLIQAVQLVTHLYSLTWAGPASDSPVWSDPGSPASNLFLQYP
jgi:hypothetical protein